MPNCDNCSGTCCGSCGGAYVLDEGEIVLLRRLAEIAFLPVSRRADSGEPIYREDERFDYTLALQCLEKRGFVSIDYDQPLKDLRCPTYAAAPVHGSVALTARGQEILDAMDWFGVEE